MIIRTIVFGMLAAALVFMSMHYVNIFEDKLPLKRSDYSLKTSNVTEANNSSAFSDVGKGKFHIHTGQKTAPSLQLTFARDIEVIMDFAIRRIGKTGEIKFTTLHNDKIVSEQLVTRSNPLRIRLEVERGDNVLIITDKHKDTQADNGVLQIQTIDFSARFQKFVIPFLWTLLLLLLIAKNYLYIGLGSYLLFLLALFAEKLHYGALGFDGLLGYTSLLFSMTFLLVFLYQEGARIVGSKATSLLVSVIAVLTLLIPLNFIVYALNFRTKMTEGAIHAVLQSNGREAYEYTLNFYEPRFIVFGLIVTLAIGIIFYRQRSRLVGHIQRLPLIFLVLLFSCLTILQFTKLRVPSGVVDAYKNYHHEIAVFRAAQAKRKTEGIGFSAFKKARGETYIFVLGESLSKKHMSLYGYMRNTTPQLDETNRNGELLVFDGAYSNHTHTMPVLKLGLTEANQYNGKQYFSSASILEVFNKAGIETHWLTNQVMYGPWDTVTSVIVSSADNLVSLNRAIGSTTSSKLHDGALILEVEKVLAKSTDKTKVIFVHLMGNHNSYSARYPKGEYTKFKGPVDQGAIGRVVSRIDKLNHYDNSVFYNDFVVSSILKALQKQGGTTGFIYTSDHAEDVIGGVGHNSALFNYHMTEIPMVAWFSEGYKDAYASRVANLLNRRDTLFSNDLLYDTLLGITEVQSANYSATHDFSADTYALNAEEALVLHGKKAYTDKGNIGYWQKNNAKYLVGSEQAARVFPHRINSIAKLYQIWNQGFRSYEIDVRFGDNNTETFQVGHHPGVMGVGLDEFLASVDHSDLERIWLDVKNLNAENYTKVLNRLNYLDEKYKLKAKVILESGAEGNFFKVFGDAQWHTSYYLPTKIITNLLREKDPKSLESLALKIAKQVVSQHVSAVSFSNKVYPFVKDYLEPRIAPDVDYHMWYGPALADTKFKEKLLASEIYRDQRVKTLLIVYASQFHL